MFLNLVQTRSEGARSGALAAVRAAALAVLLAGAGAGVAAADDVSEVTVIPRGEVYEVRGVFAAPVATDLAWEVLTDYAGIPRFVSSMKASRIEARDGSRVRLRQRATAGALMVRRTVEVVLDVVEEPRQRIAFTDVDGGDFRLYTGAWTIVPSPDGAEVRYALVVRPRAALPGFLGRNVLGGTSRRLLEEVRDEMIRRSMISQALPDTAVSAGANGRATVLAREP